jgi:hypothetical protein
MPIQPAAPAAEAAPAHSPAGAQASSGPALHQSGLPEKLVSLQQTADDAHAQLQRLNDHEERDHQRRVWLEAAVAVQAAVTQYARAKRLNRYEVEKLLRHTVRHPRTPPGTTL